MPVKLKNTALSEQHFESMKKSISALDKKVDLVLLDGNAKIPNLT